MQLDDVDKITDISKRSNFSIFELPSNVDLSQIFANSVHIVPKGDKKLHISIEQIREITKITANKQSADLFIIIEQPELMTNDATNAFLKALEEPGDHVHYVFLSNNANLLLPTVRSRANNYYLKNTQNIKDPLQFPEEIISLAKSYLSANTNKLPDIVDKITKYKKDDPRKGVLDVLEASIELSYKSYLITGNQSFLLKLEKLLAAKEAIVQNGHLKLQLIANMV